MLFEKEEFVGISVNLLSMPQGRWKLLEFGRASITHITVKKGLINPFFAKYRVGKLGGPILPTQFPPALYCLIW